jgi:hypothetical protein
MNTKNLLLLAALGAAVVSSGCATAQQPPVVDIGERHGNLREAQQLIQQAYDIIGRAQYDNNSRLGGHAARAKELLAEASAELRAAADVANEHERR